MWDVKVVLEYLRNSPENNVLSDNTLTFKLVLLFALTLASRTSEMINLNFNYFPKSQLLYFLLM